MTINQILLWTTKKLKRTSRLGDSPALDAEVLLSHVTGKTKEELLISRDRKLSARQLKYFKNLVSRRAKSEPIAYITGEKEFFGLKFKVNRSVLIPRPETELLVEEAITGIRSEELGMRNIIDVGTGSGAIAVTLAKNLPKTKIIATDISAAALKIAKQNARRHSVAKRIKFIKTNLLPPTLNSQLSTLIVANLPYLPTRVWRKAMPDVKKFEPPSALLGGQNGLDIIKKLFLKIKKQNTRGTVILEIDPSQPKKLSSYIKDQFPKAIVEIKKDLAGLFRMVKIKI